MPISPTTKITKDVPTRYDLYTLETVCAKLADAVDGLTCGLNDADGRIDTLGDNVEELRKSVDALTKVIDKPPEQLARGKV